MFDDRLPRFLALAALLGQVVVCAAQRVQVGSALLEARVQFHAAHLVGVQSLPQHLQHAVRPAVQRLWRRPDQPLEYRVHL